jgi:tryptophan 2,3-dioxygenase
MSEIHGMPGDRAAKLTYGQYLKVPELLGLQQRLSSPAHHDEMLFIISHQVYELWFKQLIHELERVNALLDRDEPLRAMQLMERCHRVQNLLIEQIPVLETMFSTEFAKFRSSLGTSSGFQSVQFRRLEFMCGAKNPRMLNLVGDDDAAREELQRALALPTPYDHFVRHLAREDHNVMEIPAEVLSRDTSRPHELHEGLVRSLVKLYRLQDANPAGERYYAQFAFAEALLTFEERLAIWRFHHVKMVERMIGGGAGTGGSSGAKYLAATLNIRLFPDLWAVRDGLGGAYGSGS